MTRFRVHVQPVEEPQRVPHRRGRVPWAAVVWLAGVVGTSWWWGAQTSPWHGLAVVPVYGVLLAAALLPRHRWP